MEILIADNKVTTTLEAYASAENGLRYMRVDPNDEQAAIQELNSIGADYSVYNSNQFSQGSGNISDGVVPKKMF